MVPTCVEHFTADASFLGLLSFQEVQGQSAQGGQILGSVSCPSAALILAEANVQGPVNFVFHSPMAPDGARKKSTVPFCHTFSAARLRRYLRNAGSSVRLAARASAFRASSSQFSNRRMCPRAAQ
jgi:hypothetical protein